MILSQDIVEFYKGHPLTQALYPTHFGIYNKISGSCERLSGTSTHILILCIGGQGFIQSESVNTNVVANDLLLIPAGCSHAYGTANDKTWDIYWTHFDGEDAHLFFKPFTDVSLINIPEGLFNHSLTIYRDYYNCLSNELTHDNLVIAAQILRHLMGCLFFSRQTGVVSGFSRIGIETVIEMMKKNVHKSLSVKEIAAKSGYSVSHFLHLFKKETGFSPIDYFNNLKIRYACEKLVETSWSIGEIAEAVGIENQHYFSRMFSKIMGLSPREYRKQNDWLNYCCKS
jgi:AraC-like DNA-binding protein